MGGLRLKVILVVLMLVVFSSVCAAKSLVFAVHPFLSAIELQERFQPLVDYLSVQSGYEVTLKVSKDYETHIEDLCAGRSDIAFIGPAVYVAAARKNPGVKLLGVLNGKVPVLRGALVVRTEGNLKQLADLKNHSVAFVSPESTMGFKLACYTLRNAGVTLDDLANYAFLGNHENVAFAVLAGKFDAGAVKYEVYETMAKAGLRVVGALPEVADHPFVASAQLETDVAEKIKNILLNLDGSEAGRKILRGVRSDAVAIRPVRDEEYNPLRLCTACLSSLNAGQNDE